MKKNVAAEEVGGLGRLIDVIVVGVGAENSDDRPPGDHLDDWCEVVRRIDDETVSIASDNPNVIDDGPGLAVEREVPCGGCVVDPKWAQSSTTERRTSPRCILVNASSTSPSDISSLMKLSSGNRPWR